MIVMANEDDCIIVMVDHDDCECTGVSVDETLYFIIKCLFMASSQSTIV